MGSAVFSGVVKREKGNSRKCVKRRTGEETGQIIINKKGQGKTSEK